MLYNVTEYEFKVGFHTLSDRYICYFMLFMLKLLTVLLWTVNDKNVCALGKFINHFYTGLVETQHKYSEMPQISNLKGHFSDTVCRGQ